MIPVVVWGAGGHALVVAETLRLLPAYSIAGFIDDQNSGRCGTSFSGSSILGGREVLRDLRSNGIRHLVLGFGHCSKRLEIGSLLIKEGFKLQPITHPSAIVAGDASIGAGTFVSAGAILESGCRIGRFVIVNSGAIICHGSLVEDAAHICPGVNLAADCRVGTSSWVGIGTSVIEKKRIGNRTFVGAGSVVTRDIPGKQLVFGVPAKKMRTIQEDF